MIIEIKEIKPVSPDMPPFRVDIFMNDEERKTLRLNRILICMQMIFELIQQGVDMAAERLQKQNGQKLTDEQVEAMFQSLLAAEIFPQGQFVCNCPECRALREAGPMSKGGDA